MSDFVALDEPRLWLRRGERPAGAALPTVGELEKVQEAARAEGLAEGRAGAAGEVARLRAVVASLDEMKRAMENEIPQQVLDLALEVARTVLQQALQVKRELLLPVVRDAMAAMPAATRGAQILLNPADIELVRASFGEELRLRDWQLVEDHRIQPGGCRLASPHCEVDATLASRWKRVLASLGADHAWLDL